jgi:hypothetical protein
MPQADSRETRLLTSARGLYLALLAAAVLVAVAVPALNLWQQGRTDLIARAAIWPASPQVGQPAQLLITVANDADRDALHGPWARLDARWDMVTMTMGARRISLTDLAARTARAATVRVPLTLPMAGEWSIQVVLTTPGRPPWHETLRFTVAHPLAAASPPAAGAAALVLCAVA